MCASSSPDASRGHRPTWLLVALAVLATSAEACRRPQESPESFAVKAAVVRYNERLVEAFRAGRAALLEGAASPAEISRTAAIISGLARRDQIMVARQNEYLVTSVDIVGPDRAHVEAREEWTYEHRPLSARGNPTAEKAVRYDLMYDVRHEPDGWVVDRVVDRTDRGAAAGAR